LPPAVIAAGVGAAGAIGGALISGHAQNSAAEQATQATTQANEAAIQAQMQLGQQSLDLQRQIYNGNTGLATDIYNQNFNVLSPYAANGLVASNSLNAMLNLPAATPMTSSVHAPAPIAAQTLPGQTSGGTGSGGTAAPLTLAQILPMQNDGIPGNYQAAMSQYYASGGH
jgi:hypothetical protein